MSGRLSDADLVRLADESMLFELRHYAAAARELIEARAELARLRSDKPVGCDCTCKPCRACDYPSEKTERSK